MMNTKERIVSLEGQLNGILMSSRSELRHIEEMIEQVKTLVESLEKRKEKLQENIASINETLGNEMESGDREFRFVVVIPHDWGTIEDYHRKYPPESNHHTCIDVNGNAIQPFVIMQGDSIPDYIAPAAYVHPDLPDV